MGKLKNQMIIEQEQDLVRREVMRGNKNPKLLGADLSDDELAQFDKEFNDWLDRYEQSFGNGEYL